MPETESGIVQDCSNKLKIKSAQPQIMSILKWFLNFFMYAHMHIV